MEYYFHIVGTAGGSDWLPMEMARNPLTVQVNDDAVVKGASSSLMFSVAAATVIGTVLLLALVLSVRRLFTG